MSQENRILAVFLACFAFVLSCIIASTGFQPQKDPEYLEVENGSGSGDYWEGERASLVAELSTPPEAPSGFDPSDYVFSHWEVRSGDGRVMNPFDPTTSYVMGVERALVVAVFELRRTPEGDDGRKGKSVSGSSSETTGPKYRKIGLNGFPIPDEKPQAADETDEEPEETFIDAFHHTLSHQVTDVYIPLGGSELPLLIRRNWTPELWNDTTGLKAHERPDRPFGPGWRSNICATIEFVERAKGSRPTATVTDENGVTYRFVKFGSGNYYLPLAENRHQQEVLATSLVNVGDGWFRFSRKMGSTLYYQLTNVSKTVSSSPPSVPSLLHGELGSGLHLQDSSSLGGGQHHRWARLATVHDRFGNVMTYNYERVSLPLFPTSISIRDKTLTIDYGPNSRIRAVTDPRGNKLEYAYELVGPNRTLNGLSQVSVAPGIVTRYSYSFATEIDPSPQPRPRIPPSAPSAIPTHYYCDLAKIRDPDGRETTFEYAFDRSRQAFTASINGDGTISDGGWYSPAGNPRNVTSVATPETTATFENRSETWLDFVSAIRGVPQPSGSKVMTVTDTAGGSWTWTFSEGEAINMLDFASVPTSESYHAELMILYLKMEVSTPEGGSMVATFDKHAGMALKSFRDVGAIAPTTFEYTDRFDFTARQHFLTSLGPLLDLYPVQYWGDPTRQIDGNGNVKTFGYDATWRVMNRVTDEENRVTSYTIDPSNGNRTRETFSGPNGETVTEFRYSSRFPGVLASKKVLGGTRGASGSGDLVTIYTPDASGNIAEESIGSLLPTVYRYDANNNKTSSTDPRGNRTTFSYDSRNRVVTIDPPGPGARSITYDARGNKVAERDENGNTVLREFDGLGRLTAEAIDMNGNKVIDSPDLVTRTEYTPLGSKHRITDPCGNITTHRYDGLNRLRETTDALSNTTIYSYDGPNTGGLQFGKGFQPTQITNAKGLKINIRYDNAFREVERSVEYKPGVFSTTRFELDRVGNVKRQTDPLGKVTVRTYDAHNRVLTTKYPDNTTTANFYNGAGNVWKAVDELGHDTLTDYDDAGRPVAVHSPQVDDGTGVLRRAVTRTTYDANGNPKTVTNPLGFVTQFSYDSRNRKLTETRPDGYYLEWRYDAVGNVTGAFDARRNLTETFYDAANRPWKVEQPPVLLFGNQTVRPTIITTYDENGNAETVTDPNGHTTTNTYDALNRLRTTADAKGIVVRNEYDALGNRTAVVDGKNQRTAFAYDGLNRNTRITDALNKVTTFEYDALNKTARVDANGHRTNYQYDTRQRLTKVTYVNRPADNRSLEYDLVGNLMSVTETNSARNVAYTYDALKRQESETSGGITHQYRYDLAGNRVRCIYGGSNLTLVSKYDAQNRLTHLTQDSNTTRYSYDPDGNVLTKTLPNGDSVTGVYDSLGRTTSMIGKTGAGVSLYDYRYEYDAGGNVRRVSETYPDATQNRIVTNNYDVINRLLQEAVTGSSNPITTTFTYDAAHNRTGMVKAGVSSSYTYNAANQLTGFTEGSRSVSYIYDANGNRTRRVEGTATDVFGWDGENRLVSLVKQSAGGSGTYAWGYDYRTRRVSLATPSAPTTRVIFSGGTSVREIEGGSVTVDYVRGSDWGGGVGGILYSVRAGVPSFTHYNRRGDVTAKTNASGALTYQAQYEAFGQRTSETGSTQDRQKSNTKDEDIPGYANEGFRFRDLETGAFLSKDPLGFVDGPNVYAYVQQNPWTAFDPDGLKTRPQHQNDIKRYRKEYDTKKGRLFNEAKVNGYSDDKLNRKLNDLQDRYERKIAKSEAAIAKIESTAKKWNDEAKFDVMAALGKTWDDIDDTSYSFKQLSQTDPAAFMRQVTSSASHLNQAMKDSPGLNSILASASAANGVPPEMIKSIIAMEQRGWVDSVGLGVKQTLSRITKGDMNEVSVGPAQLKGPARTAAGLSVQQAETYGGAMQGAAVWLSPANPNIQTGFNEAQRARAYNGSDVYGVQYQLIRSQIYNGQ